MMTATVEFGIVPMGGALTAAAGVSVPPPLTPSPVNLLRSSRNPSDASDVRWEQGFAYLPMGNGEMNIDDACAGDNIGVPVDKKGVATFWTPYLLSTKYTCSAMGADLAEHQQRAQGLLDAATPKLLEYELWNGLLTKAAGYQNLYLEQATGVDAYTATSVVEAIAICESYLSQMSYGGRGMIHMPAWVSAYLPAGGMRREGNLILTIRDTIVLPGAGYGHYPASQSGPPVAPTGSFNIYATGITDVRTGPIIPWPEGDVNLALNRATNTVDTRAYRMACASWDGIAFARVATTITL
jgi:hypothetical protein